ncbi:MAG TPA: patatin-like phospholipase family protein, partial [Myxococcaceae bacterium]|nr:patatin-like phospholipase family protein [Myxococcaceae bacterium]
MLSKERFRINRPLEEMECALVRASTADPRLVTPAEEAALRTALSLARLYKIHHDGRDVGVGAALASFREDVTRRLQPLLLARTPPRRDQLVPLVPCLREGARVARARVLHRVRDRLPVE